MKLAIFSVGLLVIIGAVVSVPMKDAKEMLVDMKSVEETSLDMEEIPEMLEGSEDNTSKFNGINTF
jgi:TATA-box binding protein (TBP) (component of TFIID and TFIIIB)